MRRMPAVAGYFYPGSSDLLRTQVEYYLQNGERVSALGVLVPHAGYRYSGAVAGRVFARVQIPEVVVLIGPNHTGFGAGVSVYARGTWETPLGAVSVATDLADRVLEYSTTAQEDYQAHLQEHSLEVQVPFLQVLRPDVQILPITMMRTSLEVCRDLGEALARALQASSQRVLLAASSDMTHYEPEDRARKKDQRALERILALDPEGLHQTVQEWSISMCGYAPTTTMLFAALALGATRADLVDYRTSGEASGDYDQVVGYAGVMVQ